MKIQLHHYLILTLMMFVGISIAQSQEQPFDPSVVINFFTQMPLYWYFVCAAGMIGHWAWSIYRKKIPGMTAISIQNFVAYFFTSAFRWTAVAYAGAITFTVSKYNADPQGFIVTNFTAWVTVFVFGWAADSALNSKYVSLKLPPQN